MDCVNPYTYIMNTTLNCDIKRHQILLGDSVFVCVYSKFDVIVVVVVTLFINFSYSFLSFSF